MQRVKFSIEICVTILLNYIHKSTNLHESPQSQSTLIIKQIIKSDYSYSIILITIIIKLSDESLTRSETEKISVISLLFFNCLFKREISTFGTWIFCVLNIAICSIRDIYFPSITFLRWKYEV